MNYFDRELVSAPKAARMVGGKRNLERLVRNGTICPIEQPNGRLGYLTGELERWQESARIMPRPTPKRFTNAELRALTEADYPSNRK